MRALDDILLGFLIFFGIDRLIRLWSNGVIEPMVKKRNPNPEFVENWKMAAELVAICVAIGLVWRFRSTLMKLNTR